MARAPVLQEIEALPEADRLEEAPHPRSTVALYGHERAEQMLRDERDRLALSDIGQTLVLPA